MLTSKQLHKVARMEAVYAGSPRYRPMRIPKPTCGTIMVVRFRRRGSLERLPPFSRFIPHRNELGQFVTKTACRWRSNHPAEAVEGEESEC